MQSNLGIEVPTISHHILVCWRHSRTTVAYPFIVSGYDLLPYQLQGSVMQGTACRRASCIANYVMNVAMRYVEMPKSAGRNHKVDAIGSRSGEVVRSGRSLTHDVTTWDRLRLVTCQRLRRFRQPNTSMMDPRFALARQQDSVSQLWNNSDQLDRSWLLPCVSGNWKKVTCAYLLSLVCVISPIRKSNDERSYGWQEYHSTKYMHY